MGLKEVNTAALNARKAHIDIYFWCILSDEDLRYILFYRWLKS